MKLTKTIFHKHKNQTLQIEFEIYGEQDETEGDIVLTDPVILSIFDEDTGEEVEYLDAEQIIEEYIDKNYSKLCRQLSAE